MHINYRMYFCPIKVLAGLFQSTGWPGCVAAVGNWFGKSKRGNTASELQSFQLQQLYANRKTQMINAVQIIITHMII